MKTKHTHTATHAAATSDPATPAAVNSDTWATAHLLKIVRTGTGFIVCSTHGQFEAEGLAAAIAIAMAEAETVTENQAKADADAKAAADEKAAAEADAAPAEPAPKEADAP